MALRTGLPRFGVWRPLAVLVVALLGSVAAFSALTVDAAGTGLSAGTVTVRGSGFGHGVGLSQYGALGMARNGSGVAQILEHYYTGISVAPVRDDVDVRVNVVHRGRAVTMRSTALSAGGGAVRLLPDGGLPVFLESGDSAAVTPSGNSLTVEIQRVAGPSENLIVGSLGVRWSGTKLVPGPATTLDVTTQRTAGSTRTRSYRWGRLQLTPVGSLIEGVAVLDLHHEYLRGVAEMPSSWPAAALQVQAVAARNYALIAARTTPRTSCGGCQLWDDTRSQVYAGWTHESDRWVAAVTATQTSPTTGLGVLYQGRPVAAYFASSTGGRTRDAADVWGSNVGYLRSVDDPWSVDTAVNPSFARWTRKVSVARILSLFELRDLASLTVTSRDAGGAARVVTATAGDGTRRSLSGNLVAGRLGLPGAWITGLTISPP